MAVGLHTEGIGALLLEKRRHLPETLRDFDVEDLGY